MAGNGIQLDVCNSEGQWVDDDEAQNEAIGRLKKLDYKTKLVAAGSFLTLVLFFLLMLLHIFAPSSALSGHSIMNLTAPTGIVAKIGALMKNHGILVILVGMGFFNMHQLNKKRDKILKEEGLDNTNNTKLSFREFFQWMQQDIELKRASFERILGFRRGESNELNMKKLDD